MPEGSLTLRLVCAFCRSLRFVGGATGPRVFCCQVYHAAQAGRNRIKIVVGLGDRYGNAFWRLIVPYSHLGSEHEVIFTDTVDMTMFCAADLLVFQRVSTPVMLDLLKELRSRGKAIIQDFDDNIHTMNPDNEAVKVYSNGKIATRIFEQSLPLTNLVTTSTQRLMDDYQKFGGAYKVCENFLPTEIFDRLAPAAITGAPKHDGEIRVGYAGSSSHGLDLMLLAKPLRKICERYPQVKLVFFGQTPDAFDWRLRQRVEYHAYVDPAKTEMPTEFMARYHAQLMALDLDIALAPLRPTTFNLGKSFLKCLEYGACGWPIVASNCGPYRDYRSRGGPILLADDDRVWVNAVIALIESQSARADLAARNRAFVREHHATAAVSPWHEAIAEVTAELVKPPSELAAGARNP